MNTEIVLLTPPFTQLNTPYPATPYIKGFLNTKDIHSLQFDLGIEVILDIFSKRGLELLFLEIKQKNTIFSSNAERIISLKDYYCNTIDAVILFLQGKNPSLSHLICQEQFLPEASRFSQLQELDWAFGTMGIQDKAKHLATLYLEDISDLIIECIDSHFGFSRYAERLGRCANSFDELYAELQKESTYIDKILINLLELKISNHIKLVCITVPFPGNLYSAFKTAQWIKNKFPEIKIAMGGGFANTELRSLSDIRVFEFFDFITLDDGEAPLENLIEHIYGKREIRNLKRCYAIDNNRVTFYNNSTTKDYKQVHVGTPDYSDLYLDKYISVIEIVNPMHRMWSDGRWNKLTMAHGCYWGKCTFCDISLDYIKNYEPLTASILCDRIEKIMLHTGHNGFHFVDEAAPPALMRDVALEIIKRKLILSWWTNIRFEKSFTKDLCILLKESGCIAVSGGLEVASDRLLELIQKGVTVSQVARVTRNFTQAGIMVHAYLMYGFPTQTAQETIDSLEMVRQLFEQNVLQSGFWHQFAMTEHSPIGMYPEKFNVKKISKSGTFANNDIIHSDKSGTDHDMFSFGLKKSLYNFMHGICFDYSLQEWFNFKVPRTKIPRNYISNALLVVDDYNNKPSSIIIWLGIEPTLKFSFENKNKILIENVTLVFSTKKDSFSVKLPKKEGLWLKETLSMLNVENKKTTLVELKNNYIDNVGTDFDLFWNNEQIKKIKNNGLLIL